MSSKKSHRKPQKKGSGTVYKNYAKNVILVLLLAAVVTAVVIGIYMKSLETKEAEPVATPVVKQYPSAPDMNIDVSKQYLAAVKMAKGGEFIIELYPDKAPNAVNNFVFLARDGYYDGVTFHRVLKDFMAQTGDPTGTGYGSPGYVFANENSDLTFDKAGIVAMANAGRDTNGSQFFITFGPAEHLNGDYTIFGQVVSGMDVVSGITLRNPDLNPSFTGDIIKTIEITEK